MSAENVSVREFELWAKTLADIQNQHSNELKDISKEIRETNLLLREDIASTKSLVKTHIKEFNHSQQQNHNTFIAINTRIISIEDTIKEQAGVYHSAKYIKLALSFVLIGVLTAWGANLAGYISFGKPEPVKAEQVKDK
ncbi:MAG: hypothetical protein MJK15_03025 [Colwellia sp.]|nr:hypothetical protein [Colwellia sp.]